jgi:hypothetical protein
MSLTAYDRENAVREMLADKVSGTLVGLWLLLPEHLRLGTWDLVRAWTGSPPVEALEPRLALQMIHEAALCINGVRQRRSLRQKGFETFNGLPFVATDQAIHHVLEQHTLAEAEALQLALGKIRQARGHFPGKFVLLDPHRIRTWSQRQVQLKKTNTTMAASKMLQTFFAIDGESAQPLALGIGSSAVTATQAALSLVKRVADILPGKALWISDVEHFTTELMTYFLTQSQFAVLMPAPQRQNIMRQLPTMAYMRQWAGYAVAEGKYRLEAQRKTLRLLTQRTGETAQAYAYKPFVSTSKQPAADLMTLVFPERWHIEEFFNFEAALGWNRASTLNLNIRFGRMSLALLAQAAIYELRKKLPPEMKSWTAENLARKLFNGIDGDLRVKQDTIIVTYYNAPHVEAFKERYENLPQKLEAEGLNPKVPWLFNFKVDFRFK